MIFKQIQRDSPENVYTSAKNVEASNALERGAPAIWKLPANAADVTAGTTNRGNDAIRPVTTDFGDERGAGVVFVSFTSANADTILAGEFGLLQIHGFHDEAQYNGGTIDVLAGTPLTISAAADTQHFVAGVTGTDQYYGFAMLPADGSSDVTGTNGSGPMWAAFI